MGQATLSRHPRRGCRAFSLLEVMIASLVLSFAAVSALVVVPWSVRKLEYARLSGIASQAMQSEIERLRLQNWDTLIALPATTSVTLDDLYPLPTEARGRITVDRRIREWPTGSTGSDIREIRLTSTWRDLTGRQQTLQQAALYGRKGLYDYYYRTQ